MHTWDMTISQIDFLSQELVGLCLLLKSVLMIVTIFLQLRRINARYCYKKCHHLQLHCKYDIFSGPSSVIFQTSAVEIPDCSFG